MFYLVLVGKEMEAFENIFTETDWVCTTVDAKLSP